MPELDSGFKILLGIDKVLTAYETELLEKAA
jgi:hypothetical protein